MRYPADVRQQRAGRSARALLAGATQDEVRRSNLSTVLRLLHLGGAHTRSQLTALTGLNRSTVGHLVTALASIDLVREKPGDVRGVGRPSLVVEPVPTSVAVLRSTCALSARRQRWWDSAARYSRALSGVILTAIATH